MFTKSIRLSGVLAVATGVATWAQPIGIYENFGFVDASKELPIDAESFANTARLMYSQPCPSTPKTP